MQDQGGRGADPARSTILAHSDLVPRADDPRDSLCPVIPFEEGSTDSETGHLVAPASRPLARLGSSVKTSICDAPAAYLNSHCDLWQLDAIISCQCALACLVYTRSGLVSL